MSAHIAIRPTVPADLATIVQVHKRANDKQAGLTDALSHPEHWRE